MTTLHNELDANFFRVVHEILATPNEEAKMDRRGTSRAPYGCCQAVAPWDGRRFPEASEFFRARCHDLTRRGFSFLMPGKPTFRRLVVRLGGATQVIYAGAEVVRTTPVWFLPSGKVKPGEDWTPEDNLLRPEGERALPMMLVGCRFTERLEEPAPGSRGTG